MKFISTGCALLNLAASQKGDGGWARGRVANIVGDKSTGKTILAVEAAAWAVNNIPGIEVVYNNAEGVMDFDLEEMYGKKFVNAVEWVRTETIEAFGRDVHRRFITAKGPMLYILDSVDSTSTEAGKKRAEDDAKGNKTEAGTYGTEKAKYLSSTFFNNLSNIMKGKDCTLMLISQVRENLNAGKFGKKLYRAGGKAFDHHCHQVCWLYQIEKLEHTYKGKKRVYGVKTRAKFEKNKIAKPWREADFPILFDYGVDDVDATISYLFGPKVKDVKFMGKTWAREDLIEETDTSSKVKIALNEKLAKEWGEIEEAVKVKRRKKYA